MKRKFSDAEIQQVAGRTIFGPQEVRYAADRLLERDPELGLDALEEFLHECAAQGYGSVQPMLAQRP